MDVQLGHDPHAVRFCGFRADAERLADFPCRLSLRHEPEDLSLTHGEGVAAQLMPGQVGVDDGLGDPGTQVDSAGHDVADRLQQIRGALGLQHVSGNPHLQRLGDVRLF